MICVHARPSELEKMGASALSHLVIAQMGRIEQLELLLAKLRREHFGPKSEKVPFNQEQLTLLLSGCVIEAQPPAQAWPLDLQFAIAEHDLARLPAIEDHVPGASLALLRRTSCRLARRQLQHSLNGGASGYIDQFVTGQSALLDQIDHGHEKLPVLGQKPGQLLLVHFSLLAYGVVAFLHGGSPFIVWQPDSFRIRLNRRSTFNYGWDILQTP
jgi:hypothetical protein